MATPRAVKPARKAKLGQNFLRDTSAAQRIVDALGDVSHSLVIEIGPGEGVITRPLARKAQKVVVIPVGTTEQHGPHLPLSVDCVTSGEMSRMAVERIGSQVYHAPSRVAVPRGAAGGQAWLATRRSADPSRRTCA